MRPHIPWIVWLGTIAILIGTVVLDLVVIARRREPVTLRAALRWIAFYVSFALAFALALLLVLGAVPSGQFLAGYVTEYSLSADNLFVFIMIVTRFTVPPVALDRVLYLGIVLSLVLRGLFIAAGAAAIQAFDWMFYVFGAFLIYTAVRLVRGDGDEPGAAPDGPSTPEGRGLALLQRVLPTTGQYAGRRDLVRVDGRPRLTPLAVVTVAIGLANVAFAVDSIPAVFGLTRSGYIVFSANAFAMMGLRQMYFLINGLLSRLTYLDTGLATILTFIGAKLVLEALHSSHIEHLGPVRLPSVGTWLSLLVIVAILGITTLASLLRAASRRDP